MMTPEFEAEQLNAFIDGELELNRQLEIERRLSHDTGLAAQVVQLRDLRQAVTSHADYHVAPAALRARFQNLAVPNKGLELPLTGVKVVVQRWFAWRPLLSSFTAFAVLVFVFNFVALQSGREDRLEQEVIGSHVRSTLTQHLVDVASSDHHTVKPWLSSKLDFSPPVPELNLPGLAFLGGRVDYLGNRPVAVLVYRQGDHVVNSFVWPSTEGDRQTTISAQRGFQIAHWTHDRMDHWVISDLSRKEFMTIVSGLELGDGKRLGDAE
ncbi:MAG: anti-sigma factor [Polaromonas sp.]|uniref:anti-sigma factor family protein n=1 Tax=Polaromonas sp. TaxID=1869339 RepID=UPI0017E93C65|nr:anti-sigma factor [Polaromonas sp.]NMM11740.1 anti-sigma factor [Polaromonas sp.]